MNTLRNKVVQIIVGAALLLVLACEHSSEEEVVVDSSDQTSSLLIYVGTYLPREQIKKMEDHLQDAFPDIIIEYQIENTGSRYVLEELLNEENERREPDIIIEYPQKVEDLTTRNIHLLDMLSFLNMYHDIPVEEAFIQQLLGLWNGDLVGIPFIRSVHALKVDKLFFEQQGMNVPEEPLTWEQLIRLDHSVVEKDIHEFDIHASSFRFSIQPKLLLAQLSTTYEEVTNREANDSTWKQIIPILQMYRPSTREIGRAGSGSNRVISIEENVWSMDKSGEWDFVAFPSFDAFHRVGPDQVTDVLMINAETSYMDEAIEIVRELLSVELQSELSRAGLGSPLEVDQVQEQFGSDIPLLAGKNVEAFFVNHPSPTAYINELEAELDRFAQAYFSTIFYMNSPNIERELSILDHFKEESKEEEKKYVLLQRAIRDSEWTPVQHLEEWIRDAQHLLDSRQIDNN